MKTLKTTFANQEYCYYGSRTATIDFNSFTDEECIDFIEEYFNAGEKAKIITEIRSAFEEFPEKVV